MRILRKIVHWLLWPIRWTFGPVPEPPELSDPNRPRPTTPSPITWAGD
jgi:hypothetical protein